MRPEPLNSFDPPPEADPPRPYSPTPRILALPTGLPAAVTAALGAESAAGRIPSDGAEGGAFLYGHRDITSDDPPAAGDLVCGLVIPDQTRRHLNYQVTREGVAAAAAATRPLGWVTLGQVHTHPGPYVEHSWYDDRNAISTKAISFVAPHFGVDPSDWLDHVGVHEFQTDWWHLLTPDQARQRVIFTDTPLTVLDLRT